jgi:hypothetical protein
MSLAPPIDKQAFESISNKEFSREQKSNVVLWELHGTRRIIESGFILRAMMIKEDDNFIDNIKLLCVNDWKTTNYKVFLFIVITFRYNFFFLSGKLFHNILECINLLGRGFICI